MQNEMNFLEIAKSNFQKWNEALQTKDAKKVAELYLDSATFLPTMSGEFKYGQEEAEGYFEHFLLSNPFGEVVSEKVQGIDENHYLHSGLYDFEVDGEGGQRKKVNARFSYFWGNENGEWKIFHHHSSVKPASH